MINTIPKSLIDAAKIILEHSLNQQELELSQTKFKKEIAAHKIAATQISKDAFPEGEDRIVIPLQPTKTPTQSAVEDHLQASGYVNHDYVGGTTQWGKGSARRVSIGKALTMSKAPQQLINDFAKHQQTIKQNPDTKGLQVVISKNPYDVIGMSQGTSWGLRDNQTCDAKHVQSCMAFPDMKTGRNVTHEIYMPNELTNGTHIAWLTKEGDNEAKEPLSRIVLRPFSAEKVNHQILVPAEKTYGTPSDAFRHTVSDWAEKHVPPKIGVKYKLKEGSHDDGDKTSFFKGDDIDTLIDDSNHAFRNLKSFDMDEIVSHIGKANNIANRSDLLDRHIDRIMGEKNYMLQSELVKNSINKHRITKAHIATYLANGGPKKLVS